MSVRSAIDRATQSGGATARVEPAPRWLAYAFVVCSLALLPWTIWLYQTLPSRATADNWDVAWTGFDVALAATLLATAVGALRRSAWTQGAASSAATLLVCDAWFDVMTSRTNHELMVAVLMAAAAEAPLALVCVWVARNSERVSAWSQSLALRRAAPPG
jgi:predicted branched-subunit amino acid permease